MNSVIRITGCSPQHELFVAAAKTARGSLQAPAEIPQDHLAQCLVAHREDQLLGRVAVYRNPMILHEGKPTIQLGAFECVDDAAAARALLDAACGKASELGAAFALGPMDGSTWNTYRFITSGSDETPFVTEMRHPAYYPGLWAAAGFVPVMEYLSNRAPIVKAAIADDTFSKYGLTVHNLDLSKLDSELRDVYGLCISAFSRSPYYSPISEDSFVARLLQLKPLLKAGFTRIVKDERGNAIAFILCLPDTDTQEPKRLVVKTAAKSAKIDAPGLITALNQLIMNDAYEQGYSEAIHAFMSQGNRSLDRSEDFSGQPFRRYALFAKASK